MITFSTTKQFVIFYVAAFAVLFLAYMFWIYDGRPLGEAATLSILSTSIMLLVLYPGIRNRYREIRAKEWHKDDVVSEAV